MFKFHRRKKMSQRELSEKADVPLRTIQDYELGRSNINGAKPKTIYKLAIALGIPVYKVVDDPELIKLMKKERKLK